MEKKVFPPLQLRLEPETFWSLVHGSASELFLLPNYSCSLLLLVLV